MATTDPSLYRLRLLLCSSAYLGGFTLAIWVLHCRRAHLPSSYYQILTRMASAQQLGVSNRRTCSSLR